MRLIVLDQTKDSLQRSLRMLAKTYARSYLKRQRKQVVDGLDRLRTNPGGGQFEEALEHLGQHHRRIVVGHFKIIYRVLGKTIVVTDIFDSRRDPDGMKG